MHTLLKHGDRVNMVYEEHADPEMQKLEASFGVVNKEIQVSSTLYSFSL